MNLISFKKNNKKKGFYNYNFVLFIFLFSFCEVDYVEDLAELKNDDKQAASSTLEQLSYDDALLRELNYCYFLNNVSDKFKGNKYLLL